MSSFNSSHAGYFFVFLSSADFFQNKLFQKNYHGNTIKVSNRLDPDRARCSVGPDLGSNCLQRLSAEISRRQVSWISLLRCGKPVAISVL